MADDLPDQLGWRLDPADAAVDLVSPRGLIRELVYCTVYDAIEQLPRVCGACEEQGAPLTALDHAIRQMIQAFELFAGFELTDNART